MICGVTVSDLSVVEASGTGGKSDATITAPTYTVSAVDGYTDAVTYAVALTGDGTTTLQTTDGNHAITLVAVDANTIEGRYEGDDDGQVDDVAFTVTLLGTTVTLESAVALEHSNAPQGVGDEVVATITVTDGDGDVVSIASETNLLANMEITDTDPGAIALPRTAIMANSIGDSLTDDLSFVEGADGASLTLAGSHSGGFWVLVDGVTRMTSEGIDLIYRVNPDGTLEGYYFDADNANAEVSIFTVTDNEDGTYTVDQVGQIDGATTSIPIGFNTGGFGGGNSGDPAYFLSSSVENGNVTTGTEGSIMVVATTPGGSGDTVNFNNNALGISQGSTIDDDVETLILTLTEGDDWEITGNGGNATVTEVGDPGGNDTTADAFLSNTITLSFWGLDAGEIPTLRVYDKTDDTTFEDFEYGAGGVAGGTINPDGTWTITATFDFDTVEVSALDDTGNGFGVSSLTVDQTTDGFDQTIEITATVTDGDEDTVSTTWDFTFDGDRDLVGTSGDDFIQGNGESDVLIGGQGNDVLAGGQGNDVLAGGQGNDDLTGDTGADVFQWNFGDEGILQAIDTITDFNQSGGSYDVTEGDVLDLSELLVGEEALDHSSDLTLAEALDGLYMSVLSNGTDTSIVINPDGVGGGALQVINLEGVDLRAGGTTSPEALESLLSTGTLVVD
jgi:hypothetical protein